MGWGALAVTPPSLVQMVEVNELKAQRTAGASRSGSSLTMEAVWLAPTQKAPGVARRIVW